VAAEKFGDEVPNANSEIEILVAFDVTARGLLSKSS